VGETVKQAGWIRYLQSLAVLQRLDPNILAFQWLNTRKEKKCHLRENLF